MSNSDLQDPFAFLRLAASDSPFFRAAAARFADDLDAFAKWLDVMVRVLKQYTDGLIKTNEIQSVIANKLTPSESVKLLERGIARVTGECLQSLQMSKSKLVDDIIEQLIEPFQTFLSKDVQDMKDTWQTYCKVLEKYEGALVRYASLSKSKDGSVLREEAFVLFEFRKSYLRQALNLCEMGITFKMNLQTLIVDRIGFFMSAESEFYQTASAMLRDTAPALSEIKAKIGEVRCLSAGVSRLF